MTNGEEMEMRREAGTDTEKAGRAWGPRPSARVGKYTVVAALDETTLGPDPFGCTKRLVL